MLSPEGAEQELVVRRLRAQQMQGYDLDGLQPEELFDLIDSLTQVELTPRLS